MRSVRTKPSGKQSWRRRGGIWDYVISRIGEGEGKKKITLASDHWLGINSSSILEPVVRLYLRKPEKR